MRANYEIQPLGVGGFDPKDFPDWDAHPLGSDFALALYRTVAPHHSDQSFQLSGPKGVALLARVTACPDDISFYGLPAVLALHRGLEPREAKQALGAALDHLAALGAHCGAPDAHVGGHVLARTDTLGTAMVDRLAKGETRAWIVADLTEDVTLLKRDIRDSYRSLINWGERNITLKAVNRDAPDRGLFALFPQFHADISGRARSEAYWDVYWSEIVTGGAELLLGWLADGTLVSGSIVVGRGRTAYYASGVYARDQFDKPLGHWPLWQAMVRAKDQGYDWFDLGELPDRWRANDKEINIAFFKRGFSSGRHLRMHWVMPLVR